jgi:hypothetical protein
MNIGRILLIFVGATFLAFGVWGLVDPSRVTAITEVTLGTPAALADGRAVYGGLTAGLGIFLLKAASRPQWLEAGLWVCALSLGVPALGRILGIVMDGASGSGVYRPLPFELLFSILAILAILRLPKSQS